MVNLGPSKGCHTCRRRKVRCDEVRPECRRCVGSKLVCGGYQRDKVAPLRFKDQTNVVEARWRNKTTAFVTIRQRDSPSLVPSLPEDSETVATCFFLTNIATTGRDLGSTRGFFEYIEPCLALAGHKSAATTAMAALALRMSLTWRAADDTQVYRRRLGEALESLRVALLDPVESKTTGTLLATLLLQFHDGLFAARQVKKAERTHQDGALALIRHRGLDNFRSDIGKNLALYVRHVQIELALQEKQCVPDDLATWSVGLPQNLSAELDTLGIVVAGVQHRFVTLLRHQARYTILSHTHTSSLRDVYHEAILTRQALAAWTDKVPAHWKPRKLDSAKTIKPPIMLYRDICEIYPSIQIASFWNDYRYSQLIMLKVSLALVSQSTLDDLLKRADSDAMSRRVQELVDSICYSVPFYLGNRMQLATYSDLVEDGIELPGYHNLAAEAMPSGIVKGTFLSRNDHIRHAVAQGAWHMTSILSQLGVLLSDDVGYQLAQSIRPGQLAWIRQQLRRAAKLVDVGRAASIARSSPGLEVERDLAGELERSLRVTSI